MLKRLLTYLLLILAMDGCSDSFEMPYASEIDADGSVVMTLDIPSIKERLTRADAPNPESLVSDITVLVLSDNSENGNSADGVVGQSISIFADDSKNPGSTRMEQTDDSHVKLWFRIDKELMKKSNLRFYFIANCPDNRYLSPNNETFTAESFDNLTEQQLQEMLSSVIYRKPLSSSSDEGSGSESDATDITTEFVMCGKATLDELTSATSTPTLTRNAAKVSVSFSETSLDAEASEEGVSEEGVIPFEVFGAAGESHLLSGITSAKGDVTTPASFPTELTSAASRYIHPTANPSLFGEDNQLPTNLPAMCYVVVKAPFNGEYYYYRLDFIVTDEDDPSKYNTLSPTANHWYKFEVTGVTGPGYASPEEASRHPQVNIQYDIHDHSPLSFNMASDGLRELGVTHEMVYNGEPIDTGTFTDNVINIKFFSKFNGEIPTIEDVQKFISIENDWLTLSEPVEVTDDKDLNGEHRNDDNNDTGVIYQFRLGFHANNLLGTLTNNITVRWMGLERVIPVTWERKFNGAEVTSVKLTVNYNDLTPDYPTKEIDDYWAFLTSTDSQGEASTVSGSSSDSDHTLWGIQPDKNNGKVRNQGFHFPVMYGSNDKYASYSYELKFKADIFGGKTVKDCSATVEGDAGIKDVVSCNVTSKNPITIKITRPGRLGDDDFTYAVGRMRIRIEFEDGDNDEYVFGLYHTGFFHQDRSGYRMDDDASNSDWRYYEVVPVKVNGDNRYILDRNLGAKSAEMYVRNADGSTLTGNPDAAGGYYRIAIQEDPKSYKNPTIFDNDTRFKRVSPPGYCVPKQNVWDAIRNSQTFHTESVGDYFNAYYDTRNSKIGKIYFPKSMFFLNGGYSGETRDGYYWTSTPATGTEKEEIGRWLKMFTISGNTTTYTNGRVIAQGLEEYGVSLRCVNEIKESSEIMRTSFNVSGATHVYLYRVASNGERIGTTTWPGHAIGNYDTMTSGKWFGFSFESSDFDPDKLYVIFNFIDKDGIIHTFSREGSSASSLYTANLLPSECNGWKVIGEVLPKGEPISNDGEEMVSIDTSALGVWWLCDNTVTNNPKVTLYRPLKCQLRDEINKNVPLADGKRRIFMEHIREWPEVYVYSWNPNHSPEYFEYAWPGIHMTRVVPGENKYWYADIPEEAKYLIFNIGSNTSQTGMISVKGDDYFYNDQN